MTNPLLLTKIYNYKKILSEIALEREMPEFAQYIEKYDPSKTYHVEAEKIEVYTEALGQPVYKMEPQITSIPTSKFNITKLPEATCDGCQ